MISEKFFCKDCNRYFDRPSIYEETHGLDGPPYQRISICPICGGYNFYRFDIFVEKIDVVQKILPIVLMLNDFSRSLKDVFGSDIKIENITSSIEIICEAISEMYDFLDVDVQRKILNIDNDKKLSEILRYLEGE